MKLLPVILLLISQSLWAQYPFEQYPAVSYKEYKNWICYDRSKIEYKVHHTIMIPDFYQNGDSLTIQLTSFVKKWDSSIVRIYRNKMQIQRLYEPMGFAPENVIEPIRISDINGDSLSDLKLIIPYLGCGIASLNVRVIYLFQNKNGEFTKISFNDKMSENRKERDLNNDGNYKIITMSLTSFEDHSYWLFNLYEFISGNLLNVNYKYEYPIMIQFLNCINPN